MFFCSTCKRVVGNAKRKPNRKTCSICLKKSAERARTRRGRRNVDRDGRSLTCKKGDLRLCSSCKCEKGLENFFRNNKSCEMCLRRKRRAKMFKAPPCLVEFCHNEIWLLSPEKSMESAQQAFIASAHSFMSTCTD